jgi:hypothetical protein
MLLIGFSLVFYRFGFVDVEWSEQRLQFKLRLRVGCKLRHRLKL